MRNVPYIPFNDRAGFYKDTSAPKESQRNDQK